jgi:hypothetical protein
VFAPFLFEETGSMKRVTAKLVTRQNDMALVEWIDDGRTRRAWVTPDMIVSEEGHSLMVNHPDGGIPYGEDWSEYSSGHISPTEIENRLKQSGIWTHEDLQQRPNVALGILRGLAGDLLQELLHNARAAQKAAR